MAVALMPACGDGGELPSFTINFALDSSVTHGCASTACGDYALTCGALMGIRIIDTDTGEALSNQCIQVPAASDLCSLGNLSDMVTFPALPAKTVAIEIALWNPADLEGDPPTCPSYAFDRHGAPLLANPYPAFGGSIFFDVGASDQAVVNLACGDPGQLASAECSAPSTLVTARVDDMESGFFVQPVKAPDLDVSVGEPRLATNTTTQETEWILEPADTRTLPLVTPAPIPRWGDDVSAEFDDTVCIAVLDRSEPQATTTLTCGLVGSGTGALELDGLLLAASSLTKILQALSLPAFPSDGLVIGRVIDHLGAPASNVTITPNAGTVLYLSADRTAVDGTVTAPHGLFVSLDAPYNARWAALNDQGRREDGDFRAGLVVGKLSLVVLKLEPPVVQGGL